MNNRQENTTVNKGTTDQEFTIGNPQSGPAVNDGNVVNVENWERFFNERIDREMGNNVDTVGNRIQIAILTAIDSIITLKIKLAIRSKNATSGRMPPVLWQFQSVEKTYCLPLLLKTCRKGTIHYMCEKEMTRLVANFRTK